jgi:hypothetical protein
MLKDELLSWRNLDESKVDLDAPHHPWGFVQTHGGQWAVQYVSEDMDATLYVLPDFVSTLVKWETERAVRDLQQQLRHLLGASSKYSEETVK